MIPYCTLGDIHLSQILVLGKGSSVALALILAFAVISFLFVITPGADWAYSISAGINWKSPVPAVTGLLTGHILATVIVAMGLGMWISRAPGLLVTITLLGAAYLLWMGANMILKPSTISASSDHDSHTRRRQYLGGLAVSGMNPKLFLLFLALLPQFVDVSGTWPVSLQMLTLGLVHVVLTGAVYMVVAFLALHLLRSRPTAALLVSRLSGVALLVIGVGLLTEQLL